MTDLRDIISEKKDHLPKQIGKLVNRLYNKIKIDGYYPDNKNVIKLKEFSTVEINNFLLECLAEYDKTERLFCEHHDIVGLRGVWAVLAFSKEENVLKYFDELIDKYIHGKPFYLHFLFELFGRVSSLMFRFLDQNRYDTSFKALIIMSLQYMLT